MAAELTIFDDGDATISRHATFTNISGAALTAVALIDPSGPSAGQARAGVYQLAFDHNGSDWDIQVTDTLGNTTNFTGYSDPFTDNGVLIPGVQIAIADLVPLLDYQSEVEVGYYAGTVVAGSTSSAKPLWVKNTGDAAGLDARVVIRPDARYANLGGTGMAEAIDELNITTNTIIGTYTLTQGESPEEVFLELDGEPLGTIAVEGTDPLRWITLPNNVVVYLDVEGAIDEGDAVDIVIGTGWQRVRLAPDVAGAPGTFSPNDLVIGALDVDEVAPFWIRIESAAGDSPTGNPFQAQLQARILSI